MDLLRVLAMLMIVFNHLVYHGVQHVPAASAGAMSQMSVHAVQANFLALQFLAYASLVATNIFFLITGYFLVKPREISYAVGKSFKLWRVIVFYSLTIYAGQCALGFLDFSWPQAIGQLMPIHSGNYWFMSNYLVVLLPFPHSLQGRLTHSPRGNTSGFCSYCWSSTSHRENGATATSSAVTCRWFSPCRCFVWEAIFINSGCRSTGLPVGAIWRYI